RASRLPAVILEIGDRSGERGNILREKPGPACQGARRADADPGASRDGPGHDEVKLGITRGPLGSRRRALDTLNSSRERLSRGYSSSGKAPGQGPKPEVTMPTHLGWQEIIPRLTLTVIAGALVGINRGEHGRPAGLR